MKNYKLSIVNYKLLIYIIFLFAVAACQKQVNAPEKQNIFPSIYPDYVGVTVPQTIAPLNFEVNGKFDLIDVTVKGANDEIHVQSSGAIEFPENEWHNILRKNDSLNITVSVLNGDKWIQYKPFAIYVSRDSIDYGVAYRLIAPGYEVYSKMGIYWRELSSFKQTPIYENTLVTNSCVNCHSFRHNNPDRMSFHVRGSHGATVMRLSANGEEKIMDTKTAETMSSCVYPYWHPQGRYIAYSNNKTNQGFHSARNERIEVVDQASDVVVYDTENNQLLLCPRLMTDAFETFPAFSFDGKKLYFCSAQKKEIPQEYKDIKYSLCSIDFDAENGTFGTQVDTLISANTTGKSISFARPSFDGKYIMFTMFDYGNFSIWHREADLYLLDLKTLQYRPLDEVNSSDTESFHDWSTNSRWFVFSSRRDDGLYTRLYIAHIDSDGRVSKPFMLPQKNPRQNETSLYSFNVPEFITAPVEIDARKVGEKLMQKEREKFGAKKVN